MVGRYLVIVTDTGTTDPVAKATVTLHGDDTISIRLPIPACWTMMTRPP